MTHVYSHPEATGLGAHHVGPEAPPLESRPAQPAEAAEAYRAAVESVGPTDEQRAKLEAFLSRTMADLDMAEGTEVELAETAENGHVLVDWTDKHGDARRTAISPGDFDLFFTEV
jgi:hypothetical protein